MMLYPTRLFVLLRLRQWRHLSTASPNLSGSYFFKSGETCLSDLTMGRLVDKAADESGDRTAFVSCHQEVRKTFSEFKCLVDRFASGLVSLGLSKGDRIGICAPNMYEWPIVQFATAKAGLIMVNVNPAYHADELEYCLKKVGCRSLIAAESFKSRNYYEMLCSMVPELPNSVPGSLKSKRLPTLQSVIFIGDDPKSGTLSFNDVFNAANSKSDKLLAVYENKVQFDDPINIQFTSGTTGNPKAATLTHHNVINDALLIGQRMGYHKQKPVLCCQVPLYHCFGCVVGTLESLLFQFPCVFPSQRFNASESIKAIQSEKCTMIYGTPTMFVDILDLYKPEENYFSSLRQVLVSGAACPQSVLKKLKEEFRLSSLHIAYGCTENSPVVAINDVDEAIDTVYSRLIPPIDHLEFKVIDETGFVVPKGSDGELCVRGHVVFKGYWNDDDKTAEVVDQAHWFHTGDLVRMHDQGYLEVIGRRKDMIIRGGENIYPQEVENFLHKHPAVLEVHICGVPDHRMGEELVAWIKVKNGEKLSVEEVKSYCNEKISHFKIPRYMLFVENFPKTVTGKVQKFRMKELSIKKLGL